MADPTARPDGRYSSDGFAGTPWPDVRRRMEGAEAYLLTTVRPDGRPHQTPLIGLWLDEAFRFCTGPEERKARNLAGSVACLVTTGSDTWAEGLDVVVEGSAERITDADELQRTADEYEAKYGAEWHFDVAGEGFVHDAGEALVFRVVPAAVFAFAKGHPGGQTRYRFG